MITGGIECILGAKIDPVFGPIIMFGLGGIYAEVMKDSPIQVALGATVFFYRLGSELSKHMMGYLISLQDM